MSRILTNCLAFGVALGVIQGHCFSGSLPNPQITADTQRAFLHIYNLDYDEAIQAFQDLRKEHPSHPGPPLYLATSLWLRELFRRNELQLDLFLAPTYFDQPTHRRMPEKDRSSFLEFFDDSQRLAQAMLAQDPNDREARYFLGSSHGVRASFAITIDHDRTGAFSHGKKAYRLHHDLVVEDPEYFDAYMSVGLYEYIVGNLPWYIKWLAAILGYSGSKERGLNYLSLAVERGHLVSEDARILQMVLFVRERMYDQALAHVRHLQSLAPKNFILRLNEAQIHEKIGDREKAAQSYLDVVQAAERGVPNFDRMPLNRLRAVIGERLLSLNDAARALELFDLITESPDPTHDRVLSVLRAGQALDLLGRRDEAVNRYWQVLELEDFEDSHKLAKRHLKRPYR